MADNFTDVAENLMLNWLLVPAQTPTRPTSPMRVALVTANGSDSAAGTEVGGGSYARQNVVFTTAASGATENNAAVTFTGMPAVTVVGVEIYDSAGSPVRLAYGALSVSKAVNAGDTFTVATGDLDITLA